jgi:hypothetical protein
MIRCTVTGCVEGFTDGGERLSCQSRGPWVVSSVRFPITSDPSLLDLPLATLDVWRRQIPPALRPAGSTIAAPPGKG